MSDCSRELQEVDEYNVKILKLVKKLKKYTYFHKNTEKQNRIITKFIIFEEKAQNLLSTLSLKKCNFSLLEILRVKFDEFDKAVELFESALDEEQFDRYKDFRRKSYYQENHEMTSTISSSSASNSVSQLDKSSSLITLSINQSIKIDQVNNKCCKCYII